MAPLILFLALITAIFQSTFANTDTIAHLYKLASVIATVQPATTRAQATLKLPLKRKKMTVYIFIAGVNDLRFWARKNIQQMLAVGSNDEVNIIIELHTVLPGHQRVSKRYYLEKNKLILLEESGPKDSGSVETIVDFFKYGLENFPAEQIAFIFWNHGTGPVDIERRGVVSAAGLYNYNPTTNMLELDRSIPFFDYILEAAGRGICYDDYTGSYLSNARLVNALEKFVQLRGGKKIEILGFDACLMANAEICIMLKPFAEYLVGSSEVEPGSGWRYDYAFASLTHSVPSPAKLVEDIVWAYEKAYKNITPDYTQSAIDLTACDAVEQGLDTLAKLLISALNNQQGNSVQLAIRTARHPSKCPHFDDPSLICCYRFIENLDGLIDRMQIHDGQQLKKNIHMTIGQLKQALRNAVIANVAGPNLGRAMGLSIYLPDRRAHKNYFYGPFAKSNAWAQLVAQYISL
jgi:hypothetical protein